jgi:hypothetical protein
MTTLFWKKVMGWGALGDPTRIRAVAATLR